MRRFFLGATGICAFPEIPFPLSALSLRRAWRSCGDAAAIGARGQGSASFAGHRRDRIRWEVPASVL